MKLSDILFKTKSKEIKLCPGFKSNTLAPASTKRSPRRASVSATPKLSKLCCDLENVFSKKVSVAYGSNWMYCEIQTKESIVPYFILDNTLYLQVSQPYHSISMPFFLMALNTSQKEFQATRDAAQELVNLYNPATQTIPPEAMGYLCDCFYYDMTAQYGRGDISTEDFDSSISQIKQTIKTSVYSLETCFDSYFNAEFKKVDFSKRKKSVSSGMTVASVFKAAKEGNFLIPYDWEKMYEDHIRPINTLDNYIPNETFSKLVRYMSMKLNRVVDRLNSGKVGIAAIGKDYINVIVGGRPGTGKTTTADALAAALGLPIYTAKVTRNTEEDAFEGMTKAGEDRKISIHDTPFSTAFAHGGIVVLEEFNLADPGVLQGAIGQAIEYPFILNRNGYEEVHRHPLCIVVATMNTGTRGAKEPNQALTSRFPVSLIMDDPNEQDFIAILQKHGHDITACRAVYKAYSAILRFLKEDANDDDMALAVTMRHCLGALNLLDDGIVNSVLSAVTDTMIGAISLRDADLAKEILETIKVLPGM